VTTGSICKKKNQKQKKGKIKTIKSAKNNQIAWFAYINILN